jgi:hypothetical protein
MQRDRQSGACLALTNVYQAIAYVLPAHVDYVGSALCGIEQQSEREMHSAPYRVFRLEGRDIVLGPTIEPRGPELGRAHPRCRVIDAQANQDRMARERAQRH